MVADNWRVAETPGLTQFLTSAVLYEPDDHDYSTSSDPSALDDVFRWHQEGGPFGIPLPSRDSKSPREIDPTEAVTAAVASVVGFDQSAKVVAASTLVAKFTDLKSVIRTVRQSELGGVPLFRPPGIEGNILALYDPTDAGNLADLRRRSGMDLPKVISGPVRGLAAEMILFAFKADPRIEIAPESRSLWDRVLGLFGWSLEETAKAKLATTSLGGNVPSGHVDFELITSTPDILVDYADAFLQRAGRQFGKTDRSNKTRRVIQEGIYQFSTQDLDHPNGRDDGQALHCFAINPQAYTRAF